MGRVVASAAGRLGRRARPRQKRPHKKRVLFLLLWSHSLFLCGLFFRERRKERRPKMIATRKKRGQARARGSESGARFKEDGPCVFFPAARATAPILAQDEKRWTGARDEKARAAKYQTVTEYEQKRIKKGGYL
ncbi:hypothetical protein pdul_cds_23 [Pandoravirus dulcis]|uniref:Uncharacterized protein n=1 Tax=Pandoravirus dulcis TaxID=1349409 RepID=S4VUX8_9VIRU|nr:hypothetical protein pdul_cds_23 [Pandoravirus dulcis]AGO81896.2 hypothetical protein pdul_cds_23 [Pandoravirus dulcis]